MTLLNTDLLRHPLNWIIVFTMLLIWAFLFDLLNAYACNRHPAEAAV